MAERLTGFDYCFTRCMKPGADKQEIREDCSLYKVCLERQIFEKLQHYEDLEEQGRLIELPCKIGDTVWELCKCDDNKYRIFPMTVVDINAYGRPKPKRVKHENQPIYNIYAESDYTYLFASFYDIGRIIFLTKAEAEAALKEVDK